MVAAVPMGAALVVWAAVVALVLPHAQAVINLALLAVGETVLVLLVLYTLIKKSILIL